MCVCLLPRFLPHRATRWLKGICTSLHKLDFKTGDFRKSTAFKSYGVQSKRTSQYANEHWLARPASARFFAPWRCSVAYNAVWNYACDTFFLPKMHAPCKWPAITYLLDMRIQHTATWLLDMRILTPRHVGFIAKEVGGRTVAPSQPFIIPRCKRSWWTNGCSILSLPFPGKLSSNGKR